MSINDEQEINEKKLNEIKYKILKLEYENSKTKNYSDKDMITEIRETIKDVVNGKL